MVAVWVAVAGSAGGLGSILFALVTDVPIGTVLRSVAVVILGMFAGLVGVYVLANSDRRDVVAVPRLCLPSVASPGSRSSKPGKSTFRPSPSRRPRCSKPRRPEDQAASLQKAPPADAAQLDAEVRDVAAAAGEANQKLPAVTTRPHPRPRSRSQPVPPKPSTPSRCRRSQGSGRGFGQPGSAWARLLPRRVGSRPMPTGRASPRAIWRRPRVDPAQRREALEQGP